MVEDTVCTIGVYGGRQPSILVNNHLVYGRMPDSETQPDIIADVPKKQARCQPQPSLRRHDGQSQTSVGTVRRMARQR